MDDNPRDLNLPQSPPPPYNESVESQTAGAQHGGVSSSNPNNRRNNSSREVVFDLPPPAYYNVATTQPGANGIDRTMTLGGATVTTSRDPVQAMCIKCRSTMITSTGTVNGQAVYGCMLLCLLLG